MCRLLFTHKELTSSPMAYGGKETNIVRLPLGSRMVFDRLPLQTRIGDGKSSPVRVKDGWFMFVGEIFNYNRTLFDSDVDLLKDMFDSMSPKEVFKKSQWWDGFWAICFYDETCRSLTCWTDPLGKKQLYYTVNGTSGDVDPVYRGLPDVCSEIKPLVTDPYSFDRLYRSEVFKWGYSMSDRTPWSNVRRILPNKLYVFHRYSDLEIIEKDAVDWFGPDPIDNPRDLEGRMFMAVNDRLISTGSRVSLLLSGGLDSSIIAAILKELKADVDLYTIKNGDDYEYAHMMAEHLGYPITDLDYSMDFKQEVEECFIFNETPVDLGSVVPNQILFKNIPSDIILSGDGADELFGGYRRINDYDSQLSDVFQELPYYHLPRLDRACSRFTKELRNPFLSHDVIRYALKLPYSERLNKKCLKETFARYLPKEILERKKLALKNPKLVEDPVAYRKTIHDMFYNQIRWHESIKNS